MPWRSELTAELKLRSQLITTELTEWRDQADTNQQGAGIHQSQIEAIRIMFDELGKTGAELLNGLESATDLPDFKQKRLALEQELTAAHGILAVFRFVFAQREDPDFFRSSLDAADLVGVDCYKPCIERAASWGAIDVSKFRVPPLTYLNTLLSPAAFTRRHGFGAFKLPLEGYLDLKLPTSIVSLPFHHTRAIWTYCALHHEVGHIIDQDLHLTDSFTPRVVAVVPTNRAQLWSGWVREMIADAFGVLLGHDGYVSLMAKLLLLPDDLVTKIDPHDRHPTPYIRMFVLAALLTEMGVPALKTYAGEVLADWRATYDEPSALTPLLDDCTPIAQVLMNAKLPALKEHILSEFATSAEVEADQTLVVGLARFLRLNLKRPDPKTMRSRLVPVAAQRAVREAATPGTDSAIHDRAVEYMAAVRQNLPQFLAVDEDVVESVATGTPREAYFRQLVRDLDFSRLQEID
jgi:hypothetical protein